MYSVGCCRVRTLFAELVIRHVIGRHSNGKGNWNWNLAGAIRISSLSLFGFTGFLLGFIGFYWVLLGFTGFYWVLLSFTGSVE